MNRKFYLVLSLAILIGIQPVFAQQNDAGKEAARTGSTIDMDSVSDTEFTEALGTSSDVELINKSEAEPSPGKSPAPVEESAAEKPALTEGTAQATEPAPVEETAAATEPALAEETPAATEPALAEETPVATEPALAEETATATEPALAEETATDTEQEIPDSIRNNQYLLESQRLAKLAEEAYNYGDYDASAGFAEEASRYAELSDEYVAQQMGTSTGKPVTDGSSPLPASYTVRAWGASFDCFWNIAARPWVYGDPHQWRVLYNANKSKLPDPNNPNLIDPGTVLDIPSLKGEVRQGAWDENTTYTPIRR